MYVCPNFSTNTQKGKEKGNISLNGYQALPFPLKRLWKRSHVLWARVPTMSNKGILFYVFKYTSVSGTDCQMEKNYPNWGAGSQTTSNKPELSRLAASLFQGGPGSCRSHSFLRGFLARPGFTVGRRHSIPPESITKSYLSPVWVAWDKDKTPLKQGLCALAP